MEANYTILLTSWLNNPNDPQTVAVGNYDSHAEASHNASKIWMALVLNTTLEKHVDDAFYANNPLTGERVYVISIRDNKTGENAMPII